MGLRNQRSLSFDGNFKKIKNWGLVGLCLVATACGTTNCRQAREKDGVVSPISTEAQQRLADTVSKKEMIRVGISDGSKQCENSQPLTQDQALEKLKGIQIFSKSLKSDTLMRAAACGISKGLYHVFEIERAQLSKALDAGFMEWAGD